MKITTFICQLKSEEQDKIRKQLENLELSKEEIEKAMNGRICDIEDLDAAIWDSFEEWEHNAICSGIKKEYTKEIFERKKKENQIIIFFDGSFLEF